MAAAAVAPVIVSVPTTRGARENVDLANPTLNWQKLEDPQVSILQCGLKYGPQAVRSMFEKMSEQDRESVFEEINMSDNRIGDEGAAHLACGLHGNGHLKRLIIPRTGITAAGMKSFGSFLASAPALEVLILSGNYCDEEGISGIHESGFADAREDPQTPKTPKKNEDGWDAWTDAEVSRMSFVDGLVKNQSLRSLCVADCRLGDGGAAALKAAAAAHPTLEHLSLAYNRLSAGVVPKLPLAPTGALAFLDLSGNSLGAAGAAAVAKALRDSKSKLTKLSLAQNELKLEGAKAMALHFQSPEGQPLEFLDLRHNHVGYRGVQEIRTALGRSDSEEGWLMLFGSRQLYVSGL